MYERQNILYYAKPLLVEVGCVSRGCCAKGLKVEDWGKGQQRNILIIPPPNSSSMLGIDFFIYDIDGAINQRCRYKNRGVIEIRTIELSIYSGSSG